ncbi:MAG: tetratricopeptide repeat protein [Planctomycetota bacterium]|jgi:serine/threonine protein kinase
MMGKRTIFGLEPGQLDELLSVITGDLDESKLDKAESSSPDDANPSKRSQLTGTTASLQGSMEQPGGQIGRYKLLRVLGEGGMGIVYLAEQKHPIRRQVALKVIKPGMDSKRVIARFEAERQALALLDHPNIAHVHDAGTTEAGRPYFVMEYVKGLSITEHCDRHKLTIEDRLNLFRQVCLAVHHGHQKGIIHRDIKPSNILVSTQDDQVIPKIIDFGVAKALAQPLTERTLVTEQGQLFGTPEYMSPEQADMANEDIDTRSDIYSLGVLLYVLLTGFLPFDSTTFREGGIEHIRQVIRETDPKTPSTRLSSLGEEAQKVAQSRRTEVAALAKYLKRELEWIPLKAMRKERAERYRSASELADDVENYLNGTPLLAGPPSTIYRLKKFVRRNRASVTGIAAVLAVLIIGVVVSTILAIGQARARAEAQLISEFLKGDVLDSAPRSIMGRRFVDEPLVEASIRKTLGRTCRSLGDFKASALHWERAYRIYLEQLGEEHGSTRIAMNWLSVAYHHGGNYREAVKLRETLLQDYTRTGENAPAGLKCNLACVYSKQGRYEEAEQLFEETLETAWWDPGHPDHFMALLYSWDLAKVYREQGRYKDAEELFVKTLKGQRQKYGEKGEGETFNRMLIRCTNELARLYVIQGRYEEAEALFTEGIEIGDGQFPGKDHPYTLRHVNGLAVLRTRQQRYEEAEALFNRALAGRKLKLGEDHPYILETINDLAVLYKEQGDYDKAESLLIEALEGRRLKLGDTHPHTLESWHNLIDLYEAWDNPEKAEEWRAKLPAKQTTEK